MDLVRTPTAQTRVQGMIQSFVSSFFRAEHVKRCLIGPQKGRSWCNHPWMMLNLRVFRAGILSVTTGPADSTPYLQC